MADAPLQPGAKDRVIRRWTLARKTVRTADLPHDLVEALQSDDVDRLVFSATPLQIKDRCIAARFDHPQGAMLVKRHTWGGLSRTLRSVWRPSVARGCWRIGRRLARRGVPTPRPRACVEERFGVIGYRSYLITDYVEGKSLYDYVHKEATNCESLETLARQVVGIWSRLVDNHISHNDMKPENFIVDRLGKVWLIDLERVRIHVAGRRMKRRQLADVRTFLHPRAWRNRIDARGVFRDAFLKTPHAVWLRDTVLHDEPAGERVDQTKDVSSRLSVLVLCQAPEVDRQRIVRAIESTKSFADEIVVFCASTDEHWDGAVGMQDDVVKTGSIGARIAHDASTAPRLATHPWVLVLEGGEAVSPVLAIDIEEQIAAGSGCDAFRIPIERHAFGQSVDTRRHNDVSPVRLLNQLCCSFSVAGGALAVSADPEMTGELGGPIERDVCSNVAQFIANLNDESSRLAEIRFHQGQSARLRRAIFGPLRQFLRRYVGRGRFQRGWAGLLLSLLESLGGWMQEVKLWQLSHEFRSGERLRTGIGINDETVPEIVPGPGTATRQSRGLLDARDVPRSKAA